MQITSFEEALQLVDFVKQMKYDLPDGQWDELKALVRDYMYSYGGDTNNWDYNAKDYFTDDVRAHYNYWL